MFWCCAYAAGFFAGGVVAAGVVLSPFRHVLMKVRRSAPLMPLALACAAQSFIFCCCALTAFVLPGVATHGFGAAAGSALLAVAEADASAAVAVAGVLPRVLRGPDLASVLLAGAVVDAAAVVPAAAAVEPQRR